MAYHGQFRRAAVELGIPDDEVGRFAELLRFAIRVDGQPGGAADGPSGGVVVGRSGGLPRLPVGMAWPCCDYGPLPFMFTFDCAALPRVDGLALPTDGSMLVFLHHEWAAESCSVTREQQYARVVYVPAGADTEVVEPSDCEDMFCDMEREFVGPECDLYATVGAELPEWLDEDDAALSRFRRHLARDLPHRRELCALADRLWPEQRRAVAYLGGYCMHTAEWSEERVYTTPEVDMAWDRLKARAQAGELLIPRDQQGFLMEEEAHRLMREWVPLVQFDVDDVHIGRFLIRNSDLAAGRLDQALPFTLFTE